jgi:hypothetical protein
VLHASSRDSGILQKALAFATAKLATEKCPGGRETIASTWCLPLSANQPWLEKRSRDRPHLHLGEPPGKTAATMRSHVRDNCRYTEDVPKLVLPGNRCHICHSAMGVDLVFSWELRLKGLFISPLRTCVNCFSIRKHSTCHITLEHLSTS